MRGDYLFSVVIPICGDSEGLSDTLESVICQDIGFEEHIQMILVCNSERQAQEAGRLCQDYERRYPDNILCAVPEGAEADVSAARNSGVKYIEGQYVTFMEAGDRWSGSSFRMVHEFDQTCEEKVDLVFCPRRYGAGNDGQLVCEEDSGIVDIGEQYRRIQNCLAAGFIRAEAVRSHTFHCKCQEASGAVYVNEILLDRQRYGFVAEGESVGRADGNLCPGGLPGMRKGQNMSKAWYLEMSQAYYMELIHQSVSRYERVIPYIQYLICSDFQWRLREDSSCALTAEEQKEYEADLRDMLSYMDDDMICRPPKMYVEYKLFALSLKYGCDIMDQLVYRKGRLYFGKASIYSLQSKSLFSIDVLAVESGSLQLSGRIWCPFADNIHIYFENDRGERFPVKQVPAGFRKAVIFGKEMIRVRGYEAELPLAGVRGYSVFGHYLDQKPRRLYIRLGKFSHLSEEVRELYFEDGVYLIGCEGDSGLWIRKKQFWRHIGKEMRLLERCLRDKKYEIVRYRTLYHMIRPFFHKERWVVMERIHVAGDNAEYFYKYLKSREKQDVKSCFSIAEDSRDFARIKETGKVIPFRGFRYKLNVLLADKIISSQGEDHVFNPWDHDSKYIRDLYKYKFIFLQHGIIKDDLAGWLNKFNKNLSMFVTSAKPEYESVLNGDYFYDKSVVKLTGLPRYDTLKQDIAVEKSIVFMPTWRFALTGRLSDDTGQREYNAEFPHSKFFQFYQRLIQDERLLGVLKERGYKGRFILHPNHKAQLEDFTDNDTIRIVRESVDYQYEFQSNALLVTDFSSVAFDFAYLKKPVVYTQFDRDTFFEGQVYDEGYFDYERDGFGPVCYDYETTLQAIIRYVEQDCSLDAEYDKRSSQFYRWFDKDNCKRVYEAIRSLDE